MTEDEIKAWFFKYGQYANGRDMALIRAIAEAVAPPRQWVGLTDEDCKGMSAGDKLVAMWADRTLKEKNT